MLRAPANADFLAEALVIRCAARPGAVKGSIPVCAAEMDFE
jgi:hypothetical protein